MSFYFAQLLTGLANASSLFLIASGLSIIFGVTRVVNFAHGSLYMLGAYLAYTLITTLDFGVIGFWGSVLASACIVAVIGGAIEILILQAHLPLSRALPARRDLRRRPHRSGRGAGDLGRRRSPRPPRAGPLQGRSDLRRADPGIRPRAHRSRPAGARHHLADLQPHALGHPRARRDGGPRDGRRARRQPALAVHQHLHGRFLPRRPRRRDPDPARDRRAS